jgi:MoxR-like ATPase
MTSALSIAREASPLVEKLRCAVEHALEGKPEAVELALVTLLARGHLFIEDVPGVGKTTLARALAGAVGGEMRRVQFTSDLLPSDVLGVSVYDQRTAEFVFRQGPIFANVLLADEINRASPRTQSALLEAMNEGQVSIGRRQHAAARPVLRRRHPEPAGLRGHLPAARVAARPLHDADQDRLPAPAGGDAKLLLGGDRELFGPCRAR